MQSPGSVLELELELVLELPLLSEQPAEKADSTPLMGEDKGWYYSWVRAGKSTGLHTVSKLPKGGDRAGSTGQPQHTTSTKLHLHPIVHRNHSLKILLGSGARHHRLFSFSLLKPWS